ncbi:MAG: aromatic hydrocarbon degradation protein, partial [Chitinophagaceae bacterium]
PDTYTADSKEFSSGAPAKYKYELTTPWKFMLSGSYVLREIEDVTKQKGFITGDIEYVTYGSNRYRNSEDSDDGLYDDINAAMKEYYKGALNFRLGGELKFTTVMARLGFSYYGNPYKDKELKGNKMFISGGLGYRHAGMFIDLTYIHALQKDISFPYRLSDKANTFANIKNSGSNLMLTLGFKI